ncbi:unnamed protein product [Paramecium sonneborni]|uniref:Transmembrane protein n=1 Tax=Paramecium sonneborni TaxID=65129 RepID=A0A8S1R4W1_9CILI|nr:unnamed protein product [Paramecium sonneborni]
MLAVISCYFPSVYETESYNFVAFSYNIDFSNFTQVSCNSFGLWSKYNPLGNTIQIGNEGMLDRNCYHLFSVSEQTNKETNMLLYECLDNKQQSIKKVFNFIDQDGSIYKFEIPINQDKYESIWYYFNFMISPKDSKFQFILYSISENDLKYYQEVDVEFPFKDKNLNFLIGGNLVVNSQSAFYSEETSRLSFFPGKFQYSKTYFMNTCDVPYLIGEVSKYKNLCSCFIYDFKLQSRIYIKGLDLQYFISNYVNCNTFELQGWIKLTDINNNKKPILYQLIKLNANSKNPYLINEKLSAFQLFYKLSESQNQLIITTYSFTFPSVNIKSTDLITKEFDLNHNISIWHYLIAYLTDTSFNVEIIFSEGNQRYKYTFQCLVNQFQEVKFQMQYGNLLQCLDCLNVEITNLKFNNCAEQITLENYCHNNCNQCDGPTESDCLSCNESQNRIFIQEYKSCICPYGTIDLGGQCYDYQIDQFNLGDYIFKGTQCSYGYFEFDDNCFRCPSIINEITITCIECLINPKEWINDAYCEYEYIANNAQSPFKLKQKEIKDIYLFDGIDLQLCESCQNSNSIFADFTSMGLFFKNFCQTIDSQELLEKCYKTIYENCYILFLQQQGPFCKCFDDSYVFEQNKCRRIQNFLKRQFCETPFYLTYRQQCVLCSIKNCIQCFEYNTQELSQNTLSESKIVYESDNQFEIGCALCKDGFMYDFTIKECIYRRPQIQNCLASYINIQGQEICTLSSSEDFIIARTIINCQKYIQNCEQCQLNYQQTIKCIICEDGYTVFVYSGLCSNVPQKINALKLFTCSPNNQDSGLIKTQAFAESFWNSKLSRMFSTGTSICIIECLDGYKLYQNDCLKYCDSNCQECKLSQISPMVYKYQCFLCSLNYYKQPMRISENGKCFQCPNLCIICQQRSTYQIQQINKYFQITEENTILTKICLKSISLTNVKLDPYLKIARYCYNNQCDQFIEKQIQLNCIYNLFKLGDDISKQFIEYSKQIAIKFLAFTITLIQNTECEYEQDLTNFFKEDIFSLQIIHLKLKGVFINNKQNLTFDIQNFELIEFNSLEIFLQSDLQINIQNRDTNLSFKLIDTNLSTIQENPIQISIVAKNCVYFLFQNLIIQNIRIKYSNVFQINYDTNSNQTSLKYLQMYNCKLQNSILFNFLNIQQNILIEQVIIDRCQFEDSSIFNFISYQNKTIRVIINKVTIKNSLFKNSSFIQNNDNNNLFIDSFLILDNQFQDSKLISLNERVIAYDFQLNSNKFVQSVLFTLREPKRVEIDLVMASQNQFQNFIVINSDFQQTSQQNQISLSNIKFQDNIHSNDVQGYLFIVIFPFIQISNVQIKNTFNQRYFYLLNTQQVIIKNITYENDKQDLKVPSSLDCLTNVLINSQLIQINEFQDLLIENVIIQNQKTLDVSLIDILQTTLQINNQTQTIKISNVQFVGNILLKAGLGNLFSLLTIYSEKVLRINLENIQFQENIFNQFSVDPTQTSSGLLFINSYRSSIILNKIASNQNAVTNSTNTFFTIFSYSINITNMQASFHNHLSKEFWNKYYDLNLQNTVTQQEINYLIQKSYSFINQGGVMKISAEYFTLYNSQFQYIIAESSTIFKIITQGQGFVDIFKCNFLYAENNLLSNIEKDGALNIDSRSSHLHIKITDLLLIEIQNQLGPSIFTIYPSPYKNTIILQNFLIQNCYSLRNSFFQLSLKTTFNDQNNILFEKITIVNTAESLIQFHQKLNYLDLQQLEQIINDNAIINIIGGKVKITKLQVEGILIQPLIKTLECSQITLTQLSIQNIKVFFSQPLIQIEQIGLISNTIQITNIVMQYIQLGVVKELILSYFMKPNILYNLQKCKTINYIQTQNQSKVSENITNLFESIQLLNNREGSLISIKSYSNRTKINLSSLKIINNDCQMCWNGIIYFNMIDFLQIQIQELFCIKNFVKMFGCIKTFAEQEKNGQIFITKSYFFQNQGTQGIAVQSENVKIFISKSKIFNNNADLYGGGLYLKLSSEDFSLYQTIIINNKAREAGGIYLNQTSILKKNNFNQSLLLFNSALQSTNNLQELPSFLELNLNNKKMMSISQIIGNKQINSLKLKSYKVISQGQTFYSNFLQIPSNQKISSYKIYDIRSLKFYTYINQCSLTYKNQLNEQLINFQDSQCSIKQKIYDIITNKEIESYNVTQVNFDDENNYFDLNSLNFSFDPYQQNTKKYEIQIECKLENQENELQYNLQVKSFFCQLGEFYTQNGCQICQSSQGFYSVDYNTTKCSIFDKNKFEAITSNQLQLKQGYWRPNYLSDIIDLCFKKLDFCKGGWSVGNDLCVFGHIGGFCEECDKYNVRGDGYFFQNQQSLQCFECKDLTNSILPFVLTVIWTLLINLITLRSIQNTNKKFNYYRMFQKFGSILFKLNLDYESILLKLFLNYLWIFSLIFIFNINLAFNFLSRTTDTSYFLASNLDCQLIQNFNIELIYSRVMAMLFLMILQVIIIQIGFNLFAILSSSKIDSSIISVTILYLFIQNYAALIRQLFSIIAQRQISNIDFIQGDVSLQYGHGNHLQWIYFFVVPILALIGVIMPLTILLLLYFKRDQINQIKFRKHVGYLFNEYTSVNFFWEWIKLWKKSIIIIILIQFESYVILNGIFIGMTLVVYQLFATYFSPYVNLKLNKLDIQSVQICLFTILLAIVKYICDQQENEFYSKFIQSLIIILCIRLSIPYLFNICRSYYKRYKTQLCEFLLKILENQKFCLKLSKKISFKIQYWKQQEERIKKNCQKLRKVFSSQKTFEQFQRKKRTLTRFSSVTRDQQFNTETDCEEQIKLALKRNLK